MLLNDDSKQNILGDGKQKETEKAATFLAELFLCQITDKHRKKNKSELWNKKIKNQKIKK
jgi:hypothetical protein